MLNWFTCVKLKLMITIAGIVSVSVLVATAVAILLALTVKLVSDIASNFYGAPFVPTSRKIIRGLLNFGGLGADDVFYDLGSGDGRVLISAVKDFGVRKAVGYEATLWPYLESAFGIWQKNLGETTKIHRQNFFRSNLNDATFIYLYLFPNLVNTLAAKLSTETRVGTKILSVSFPIDLDVHPRFKLLKTGNFGKITAYLYEKV